MIQVLLHLIGDYVLQNDWMAQNKAKQSNLGIFACAIHCAIYSLPFALYYRLTFWPTFFILGTHALIDHYRLAEYWIKFINWNWGSANYGYDESKPKYMSVWLFIIIDNTFHLICNYIALNYL